MELQELVERINRWKTRQAGGEMPDEEKTEIVTPERFAAGLSEDTPEDLYLNGSEPIVAGDAAYLTADETATPEVDAYAANEESDDEFTDDAPESAFDDTASDEVDDDDDDGLENESPEESDSTLVAEDSNDADDMDFPSDEIGDQFADEEDPIEADAADMEDFAADEDADNAADIEIPPPAIPGEPDVDIPETTQEVESLEIVEENK